MGLEFDEFYTNRHGDLQYPFLFINDACDALAILLNGMNAGTLPVLVNYKGKLAEIKRIEPNLWYLKRLIKLFDCTLFENEGINIHLSTAEELLKAEYFTINSIF